jgi:hypothetical protein
MSIKWDINNLGWLQIFAELCRDFYSLNDASHHKSKVSGSFKLLSVAQITVVKIFTAQALPFLGSFQ